MMSLHNPSPHPSNIYTQDLFMTMDKDGDGTISSTDLYTALTQVGRGRGERQAAVQG